MTPAYLIQTEPRTGLVYIKLEGLFDVETVTRFREERDDELIGLTCPPDSHFTLLDATGCLIQPQDSASIFAQMMASPPRRSRRMAIVVSSMLAQLQVKTWLAGRHEVSIFDARKEAIDWLVDGGADRAGLTRLVLVKRPAPTCHQSPAAAIHRLTAAAAAVSARRMRGPSVIAAA